MPRSSKTKADQSYRNELTRIWVLPPLWFGYLTLRYSFDCEGVSLRVGLLFKREVLLTYRRIPDIHVTSNIIRRGRASRPVGLGDERSELSTKSLDSLGSEHDLRLLAEIRDLTAGLRVVCH